VGIQIDGLFNYQRKKRITTLFKYGAPVSASHKRLILKFFHVSSALETKPDENLVRSVDRQAIHVHFKRLSYCFARIILFVYRHRNMERIACHLHNRIDDATVILLSVVRSKNV
jgi:hypothetical protein